MNSNERVVKTLEFQNPDRIPVELWLHTATGLKYGKKLAELLDKYPQDILRITGPTDVGYYQKNTMVGEHVDVWGSTWRVLQEGMLGEVMIPAIKKISDVSKYIMPFDILNRQWIEKEYEIDEKIQQGKNKNQFLIGGEVHLFEKMQSLRGSENLFYDLALNLKEVRIFIDKLVEYYTEYLEGYWLKKEVDAIMFYDDWGSQKSLLISPDMWENIFKPAYRILFEVIKKAGKYIFFHSCGYILELYDDFIELGVNAINSQVWCMELDKVAQKCAGKITLWGEIDRQKILAFGAPQDIYKAAAIMKEKFYINGGGLIGQSLAGKDVSLENIEALLKCWNI
jgi:uroporphyrinogen decarboxylase